MKISKKADDSHELFDRPHLQGEGLRLIHPSLRLKQDSCYKLARPFELRFGEF